MRILLIEDEPELATWLARALEQGDFSVQWTNDGLVAERMLALEEFDAVILDLGLPGKSGQAVLSAMRAAGNRVPVIILTASGSLAERVSNLHGGADDFLSKPFELAELEARLFALLRRSRGRDQPRMTCGPLALDSHKKQFLLADVPVALTPREYAMLSALIARVGEPVSKLHLFDRIFVDNDEICQDAIEVLAYRLRKKLAGAAVRIVTMRGFGYCLESGGAVHEDAQG